MLSRRARDISGGESTSFAGDPIQFYCSFYQAVAWLTQFIANVTGNIAVAFVWLLRASCSCTVSDKLSSKHMGTAKNVNAFFTNSFIFIL